MGHKLRQSGDSHPKSYKCCVCDTLHDDYGNIYDPDATKKVGKDVIYCPYCGFANTVIMIISNWIWCDNCNLWFEIDR